MKTIIISILISTAITVGLLFQYTFRVVHEINHFYDLYYHSASWWVCTDHEPSNAYPELRWVWQDLSFRTHLVCLGEPVDYIRDTDELHADTRLEISGNISTNIKTGDNSHTTS